MSQTDAKEFLQALTLAEEVQGKSAEEVCEIAEDIAGLDFTPDELREAGEAYGFTDGDGELAEDQLEKVAGGLFTGVGQAADKALEDTVDTINGVGDELGWW